MQTQIFIAVFTTFISSCGGNVSYGSTGSGATFSTSTGGSTSASQISGAGGQPVATSEVSTGGVSTVGTTCDDLLQVAQDAFYTFLTTNHGCTTNSDCIMISSSCAALCGDVVNSAAAPAADAYAAQLCAPFLAQGCKLPRIPCFFFDPIACTRGSCWGGQ